MHDILLTSASVMTARHMGVRGTSCARRMHACMHARAPTHRAATLLRMKSSPPRPQPAPPRALERGTSNGHSLTLTLGDATNSTASSGTANSYGDKPNFSVAPISSSATITLPHRHVVNWHMVHLRSGGVKAWPSPPQTEGLSPLRNALETSATCPASSARTN